MKIETVKVEDHILNCACDTSTPYSQIVRAKLMQISPKVESQSSDLIISSGEYSHITYMQECVVTVEFRGVVLHNLKLLISESEVKPGVELLLGRDVLSRIEEESSVTDT